MFRSLKFQLSLDEFKQFQLGAIRTHMYHTKSTQGKETLKTEVKLTHVEKNSLTKTKFVLTPISDLNLL